MKILKKVIPILLAVALLIGTSVPVFAATSATISITATPTFIALTNDDADWAVGTVVASATYWWTTAGTAPSPEPFEADDMIATITNTGSVTEDIDVKVAAFTGGAGWAISTDNTPAEDEVSIRAGITGTTNAAGMIQVITTDTELVADLAASGTKKWCMSLGTGTFTDGTEKTGTVTLTATAG